MESEAKVREESSLATLSRREKELQDEAHDALRSLRSDFHETSEKRLRLLRQQWEEEMAAALSAKGTEIEEIVQRRLVNPYSRNQSEPIT